MNRLNFFLAMILTVNTALFAQNYSISTQAHFNKDWLKNWNLSVAIHGLQPNSESIVLEFPNNINFIPIRMRSGSKEFWLKMNDQKPISSQAIHWQKEDSLLILQFAPDAVFSNGLLTIDLQIYTRPVNANLTAQIKLKQFQPDGSVGPELARAEFTIPQSVNKQTR